ncbi:hypothetical protein [Flavobacterium sp. T12S277]|uniref:hypothetical protein n=1 Tax=Flavobacterium sp. T12S277 TaxID=3402752 RepID=UPI003AE26794
MEIARFLKGNFGNILGIIGIILAYYFYYKGKSKKEIFYEIIGFNLINENLNQKVSELKISYKNKDIKYLTVSKIAIWNSGNTTIWENEIPENNKIQINICNNYEILEYELIENEDVDSKLNITKIDDKHLEINFKFLEPNKGVVLKLIHTSKTSNDVSIKGRIIGGSEIKRINDIGRNNKEREHWSTKYFGFLFGVILLLGSFHYEFISFTFIFLFSFGILITLTAIYQITLKKVPKSYEKIYLDK